MKRLTRIACLLAAACCLGCGTGPRNIFDRVLQSKVELTDALYFVTSEESAEQLFMPAWERYTKIQTELELELIDWGKLGDTPALAREFAKILDEQASLDPEKKREEAKKKAKDKDADYQKILDYCNGRKIFLARSKSMKSRYDREVERLRNLVSAYQAKGMPCPMLDQAIRDLTTYNAPSFEAGEISPTLIVLFPPKETAEADKEWNQAMAQEKKDLEGKGIQSRPPSYRLGN